MSYQDLAVTLLFVSMSVYIYITFLKEPLECYFCGQRLKDHGKWMMYKGKKRKLCKDCIKELDNH